MTALSDNECLEFFRETFLEMNLPGDKVVEKYVADNSDFYSSIDRYIENNPDDKFAAAIWVILRNDARMWMRKDL